MIVSESCHWHNSIKHERFKALGLSTTHSSNPVNTLNFVYASEMQWRVLLYDSITDSGLVVGAVIQISDFVVGQLPLRWFSFVHPGTLWARTSTYQTKALLSKTIKSQILGAARLWRERDPNRLPGVGDVNSQVCFVFVKHDGTIHVHRWTSSSPWNEPNCPVCSFFLCLLLLRPPPTHLANEWRGLLWRT